MKISVFYEHIEKACEQTKKPLEEVLEHVKKSGIDGIEMDYDMLSSEDDEQSILTSLKKAGLVISSIYGFCHLDSDPEEQKCLDVIDQAAKNGCSRVLLVPGFFSEADAKIFGESADDWEKTVAFMQSNQVVQNIMAGLRRAVAYAKENNVIVTLEDFDSTLSPSSRINALKWFMEQVPGLCWTLDAGNFAYSSENILDAYEDLEEDNKKGRYNPFIDYIDKKEELKNKVDRLISMSLGMATKNIEQLNLEFNKSIIDNIIYSGVYLRYKSILEKGCESNVQ